MNIRTFQESDFPAIANIYALSKLDELSRESGEFSLIPLEQDDKRLHELRSSQIFVYDVASVVGYAAVFDKEVRALFVHPSFRGKGVGRRLLEHIIAQAGSPLKLCVVKTNIVAQSLYQKYGFEATGEFTAEYGGKEVVVNEMVCNADVCLEKSGES